MSQPQAKNPLHGITLEQVVTQLADHYGWDALGAKIAINCFKSDPSVKSSLKFLRKTDWARAKVEALYIKTFSDKSALNADASGASNLWTSGAFKKN